MDTLKLNLHNLPALELLTRCEQHAANINALAEPLRVNVRLTQLNDAVAAARASHDEVEALRVRLKAALTRRNQNLRAARTETTSACGMVAVNANLDPTAISAAGLPLKSAKQPIGKPGVPAYFTAAPGDDEGEVKLKWKRPVRRCTFMLQMRREGETKWQMQSGGGGTKEVVGKLPTGAKLWFRVCAVNAHGAGPWSQPVAVRVR
jgi:hypothetical protein